MKKIYSLFLALFGAATISAQSAGIYESYAILSIENGSNTYYDLYASTPNPDFGGGNLGTFYTASSLVVSGGQNKIYKCNGADVSGGSLFYRVYKAGTSPNSAGAFTEIPMNWVSDDSGAGPGCQNQTWMGTSGSTNLIAGLDPGNYQIEIYTSAATNLGSGTVYANNNGDNYVASFTVTNVLSAADFTGQAKKYVVADGKLLTSAKGNLDISVYDFSGKLVRTMKINSDGNPIDLNISQKGIYLLKVSNGTSSEVVKFAK